MRQQTVMVAAVAKADHYRLCPMDRHYRLFPVPLGSFRAVSSAPCKAKDIDENFPAGESLQFGKIKIFYRTQIDN